MKYLIKRYITGPAATALGLIEATTLATFIGRAILEEEHGEGGGELNLNPFTFDLFNEIELIFDDRMRAWV